MEDLASRFNPRTEEDGLKLEAEEKAKKLADSDSSETPEETESKSSPGKDLVGLVSDLNLTKPADSKDGSPEGESEEVKEEANLIQSTYEVKVKLADLQADPNSPLYSAKSFEELGL